MATEGPWTSLVPKLSESTLESIKELGFESMTEVQAKAIPLFMSNKDVVVEACTGSGKTLSFVIPIIEILSKRKPALQKSDVGAIIILPTRELAGQVKKVVDHFTKRAKFSSVLLVGGTSTDKDLKYIRENGCNIIVATCGRLYEVMSLASSSAKGAAIVGHKSRAKTMNLKTLEILVFDEGDRLLEMGFSQRISRIVEMLPKQRRTGLFSATQTEEVEDLSKAGTRNPVFIKIKAKDDGDKDSCCSVGEDGSVVIPKTLMNTVMIVDSEEKISQLIHFLNGHIDSKVIVYFLTCSCVSYFSTVLAPFIEKGSRKLISLHGKASQAVRDNAYKQFVSSKNNVMFCTDVAARGLDIPDVDWIVQFDAPQDPKVFVHRIGRTARMGSSGNAILFVTPDEATYIEFLKIRKIELTEVPKPEIDDDDETEGKNVLLSKIKEMAKTDRNVYLASQDAFVTYLRAYKEHQCSFIFSHERLDIGALARGFALLKLPVVSELKSRKIFFTPEEGVDVDMIPFPDKKREGKRLEKLEQMKKDKVKNEREKQKALKQKIREKKEKKQKGGSYSWSRTELDELADDARALKKLKRKKISAKECDIKLGIDSDDDLDLDDDDTPVARKKRRSKPKKKKQRR